MEKQQFILCSCSFYKLIPEKRVEEANKLFVRYGVKPLVVDDLCKCCVSHGDKQTSFTFDGMLEKDAKTIVLGCYPRAVASLLKRTGLERVEVINLRSGEDSRLEAYLKGESITSEAEKVTGESDGWIPWFPVIDTDRCTNCHQCLDFCLFGVFSLSGEGNVEVGFPKKCKTNCPACARICPEVALIFPKYKKLPINGGPIIDEEQERLKVEASKKELLGNDVYKGLKMRQEKRKRMLFRRQELEKAYKERDKYTRKSGKSDGHNK